MQQPLPLVGVDLSDDGRVVGLSSDFNIMTEVATEESAHAQRKRHKTPHPECAKHR